MGKKLLTFGFLFLSNFLFAQFGPQQIISNNAENPYITLPFDIDNDGFIDVLSAHQISYFLKWNRNLDGAGNFSGNNLISNPTGLFLFIEFVDLDSDGDQDILYMENNPQIVGWFENIDGNGTFNTPQIILQNFQTSIFTLKAVDVDQDGDMDITATSNEPFSRAFFWFENVDGMGAFGDQQMILENYTELYPPLMVDLDNDGLLDILTAHNTDNIGADVVWFRNLGDLSFGPEQIIYDFEFLVSDVTKVIDINYLDINSDTKKDIILTADNADFGSSYSWIENLDNLGSFGEKRVLPQYRVFCDVDNDGDHDIIFGNTSVDRIYWVENVDGLGNFTIERTITTEIDTLMDIAVADFNGDGLMDLVSASIGDEKVAWYENTGVLGVPENEVNKIAVYPNPANQFITVNTSKELHSISIFNVLGTKALTVSNTNQVNLEKLQQGIYFLEVLFKDGSISSEKILKL